MELNKINTIISSGHYEIPGTDRFDDCEQTFGKEYVEYRKKWNEYPKRGIVNEFPFHLDVESTNACNLRCTMCPWDFTTEKVGYMDWNLFTRIIDEGAKYGLASIKLCHRGEPLLHPQLPQMVAYAKNKGILEVQFNTNGLTLNRGKTDGLLDAGLDRIIFSVDGASKETYEKIRCGSEYDRVVNNITTFVARRNERGLKRPCVRIQMIKMDENKHETKQFLEMWLPIANRVAFSVESKPLSVKGGVERFPCPQIWQRMAISWDGEVRMCCWLRQELVLGNATESRLYELWHGEKLANIRKLHSLYRFDQIPACAGCDLNMPRADSEIKQLVADMSY